MKTSSCLLLCTLLIEGLCIVRYCIFRLSTSNGGRSVSVGRRCFAAIVNLVFMGFTIMVLMSYIHDRVKFRDSAVLIGLSVMTEKLGYTPLEVHWSESMGGVKVVPSNTNECICIQLMREPFGVYVH